ncbi:exocyst complex component 7-like isoform X3 [Clavelina lepadiformis]|uniref:exocyst complex component 7-like isoform X3 n=1 Tax=Clavelina lepadiformis TaxID=159417 RepID=UPI0040431D9F
MEDIFLRKQEIEDKLSQERMRSEMIKGSLAKADELTNKMVTILNQFDERLHKLEDTILPVHRNTKDLQRLQDNIEKTIVSLDHVIGYHHVAHEVESVLRQGPSRQVERYLKCMDQLGQAVAFFSENNPDSPELNTVSTLFTNGKESLEKEFQGQLQRQTKPLPPNKVMNLINHDKDTEADVGIHLHEKTVSDLALIAQWLAGPGKSEGFTKSYAAIRSSNLVRTLEGLRDFIKGQSSVSKKVSVGTTPKKSGTRRASYAAIMQLQAMGKSSYAPIAEEEIIEVETEPFVNMVSGCVKLFYAEQAIMQSIIPDKHKQRVFDDIIKDPLDKLEQTGMTFVAFEKQCITRHDHPLIITIFPAIQHLKQHLPAYQDILKSPNEQYHMKLPRLIYELESTGVVVLDDFADCVKSDPEKESNMPKDGTVHELTSNAMLFLQQLAQNADVAGGMLASQRDSQQSLATARRSLSTYISHVLGALKLNLDNKARVYLDNSLAAIFLLNNYHFILNALNRHGLLQLTQIETPEIAKLYNGFIEEQKITYLKCWDKFQGYLSAESKGFVIQAQPGTKLKDKDKQVVKEKFKLFNNEFEELVKTHQQWAMPSLEVKKEIRRRVKQIILLDFTSFRDMFRMVQFTKNIDKYLKYTPESVEENIERLFDQCAT